MRSLGHFERMEGTAMLKRVFNGRICPKRSKGRPRIRWLNTADSDLKKTKVKGWKEKMRDREQWRLAVGEAKAH
jgi:hypothetical protein